jgi:hypothetical protein
MSVSKVLIQTETCISNLESLSKEKIRMVTNVKELILTVMRKIEQCKLK